MKRIIALLLIVASLTALVSCADSTPPETSPSPSPSPAVSPVETQPATRTVTDVWGREVEIPYEVESIICLGSGAPRIAAYLEVTDMMVGIEEHDSTTLTVLRDYNPVYHEALKDLPIVGAGGGSGNNNGYPEEIITVAPDVILAGFTAEAADELYGQTQIPVVCVRYISQNFIDTTFYAAMRVFAEVTGSQERCDAVLTYIDDLKADLNERTADIGDGAKLKAYTGAVTFSGRHGFAGTYANFGPFMGVNALNVADEIDEPGYFEADLEKIVVWDPDVIFLDPGNMDMVNDEYAANPDYFNALQAVQNNQVFTMPSFNNCGTNVTYAIMNAYYAGIILFPDRFADVDIEEKSAEILTFFLGEDIYGQMADGGLYYGAISIGG